MNLYGNVQAHIKYKFILKVLHILLDTGWVEHKILKCIVTNITLHLIQFTVTHKLCHFKFHSKIKDDAL